MRLDKFLSTNGFGSRRDAKKLVKKKAIKVNDVIVRDPSMILNLDHDTIKVNDIKIDYKKDVYYMLNKPANTISSHDAKDYPSVLDLIDDPRRDLIIVGRLDVDTEGLLLITNDGQFSHRVSHGKKDIHKQYYVELEEDFNSKFIKDLEHGIPMDDGILKPAKVELVSKKAILLSIAEGKYHQVKRMMHYCENEVTYLKRVQIGDLRLDKDLDLGEYRELTENEIKLF